MIKRYVFGGKREWDLVRQDEAMGETTVTFGGLAEPGGAFEKKKGGEDKPGQKAQSFQRK